VRLSLIGARRYNWLLLIIAFVSSLLYVVLNLRSSWQLLMVLSLPFLIRIGSAVSRKKPVDLDPYLKQMSLTTFLFVITLGLGELLA